MKHSSHESDLSLETFERNKCHFFMVSYDDQTLECLFHTLHENNLGMSYSEYHKTVSFALYMLFLRQFPTGVLITRCDYF